MPKTVLLHHSMPDGSWHHDWLIQRQAEARSLVPTFRTIARVDDPVLTGFEAEQLADHRPLYLTHEGPVSGNRGSVRRVASGEVVILAWTNDLIQLELTFGGITRSVLGRRREACTWWFKVAEQDR